MGTHASFPYHIIKACPPNVSAIEPQTPLTMIHALCSISKSERLYVSVKEGLLCDRHCSYHLYNYTHCSYYVSKYSVWVSWMNGMRVIWVHSGLKRMWLAMGVTLQLPALQDFMCCLVLCSHHSGAPAHVNVSCVDFGFFSTEPGI